MLPTTLHPTSRFANGATGDEYLVDRILRGAGGSEERFRSRGAGPYGFGGRGGFRRFGGRVMSACGFSGRW